MTETADKRSWNKFIADNSVPSSFLQSWEWGEFQEALGNKVYRLSFPGEGEIGLMAQVIVKKLPLGRTYLEIPKGPISPPPSSLPVRQAGPTWGGGMKGEGVWERFVEEIEKIGQREKAVLARINPPYPSPLLAPFRGRGVEGEGVWRKPEILLHQTEPEHTILVDLGKSEDELLQNMHEKSRYNIRLAQRKGVTVRDASADHEAFGKFLDLLEETTKRDGIVSWPHERFWKFRERFMLSVFPSSPGEGRMPEGQERSNQHKQDDLIPRVELLIGELGGKILAAATVMLFGDAGTYLYAASSGEERNANAPSLVLWEAIRQTKARGKKWYDLWGIAPDNSSQHPWAGITRFKSRYVKLGVTGKKVTNLGTRDLVLDKKFYTLFRFAKKIRGQPR